MSPVLVGRSSDLELLDRALSDLPTAVLLGGDAGVGKTRLIREFTALARERGARVLSGGCLEFASDGLPFAPFTAVLRALVREMGTDGVRDLLCGVPTTGLSRLLPEFGEPDGDERSGDTRARLFEVVLTLLERLAEREPVVLVIEDGHWADRSTRDLIAFLLRNLDPAARLLVIVTYRTDELHRTHPLRPLLAELHRVDRVRPHELRPLPRRAVADLAASILGERPDNRLLNKIYARTQGNPLFIEVLLGCDGRLAGEIPESLRDLLLAGTEKLPEEVQDVLRLAAVGGVRIEHALLAAVAGLDDTGLARLLRPAVAANVLVVDGDGYVFRHALIREAVHDDLLPGEHSRMHACYAEALRDDPALLPSGDRTAAMAHHWHEAGESTMALVSAWQSAVYAEKAVAHAEALHMLCRVLNLWDRVPDAADRIGLGRIEVLEKAVGAACLSGEYERGFGLATAALAELAPPVSDASDASDASSAVGAGRWTGAPDGLPRIEGLRGLERLHGLTELTPLTELGEPGAPRDGAPDDRGRTLDPRWAALASAPERDRARVAWLLEQRGMMALKLARDEGLDDLRTAVRVLPVDPPTADLARVLSVFAKELYFKRRIAEAREVSAWALNVARQVDDPLAEASTLLTMICIDAGTRDFEVRLADLELIRRMTGQAADYQMKLRLAVNVSDTLEGMGAHEEAADVARRGILDSRRYGVERITGTFLAINLAEPLVSLGRWDEAQEVIEHALQQDPPLANRAYLHVLAGELKLARGDLGGAGSEIGIARQAVGAYGYKGAQDLFAVIRAEAALHLAAGDVDALLVAIEPALHPFDLPDDPRYAWPVVAIAAAACADALSTAPGAGYALDGRAGDRHRGGHGDRTAPRPASDLRAALATIESRAEKLTVHGPVQAAHRLTFLAESARAHGDLDGPAWEAAAAAWNEIGQPYAEAKALWRAAEARIAAGDRDGAADPLNRAAELARGLGAAPLQAWIGDLARRGRVAAASAGTEQRPPAITPSLTPRETQVLGLVAEGRSNREIAEALFISVKTASVHVSNILAKLQVGGRGEAAAAAHRLDLLAARDAPDGSPEPAPAG